MCYQVSGERQRAVCTFCMLSAPAYINTDDTAYGVASGHMLFSAVKMQITTIAIYSSPFYLGT